MLAVEVQQRFFPIQQWLPAEITSRHIKQIESEKYDRVRITSRESGLERAEVGSALVVQYHSLTVDNAVRKTSRTPGYVAEAIRPIKPTTRTDSHIALFDMDLCSVTVEFDL